jgi:hypothetical protein
MGDIEHAADDWQPRPGQPHPIDKAFYDLAIKERDYERVKVDRLERQLAGAVEEAERLRAFIASKREVRFEARCRGLISSEQYVASLRVTGGR